MKNFYVSIFFVSLLSVLFSFSAHAEYQITAMDKEKIAYIKRIEELYQAVTKRGMRVRVIESTLRKILEEPGKISGEILAMAYPYVQQRKEVLRNFIVDNHFENLTLDDDDLINLATMGRLVLRGEYLSYDVMEQISQLKWLTEIDIQECFFEDGLTDSFASLKKLKTIVINTTNLEVIPSNFDQLENLETLNLKKNAIQSIPKELFYNKNHLKKLNLSGNNLKTIPSSIVKCKNFINKHLLYREHLNINKNPHFLISSNDPDNLGIYELEELGIEPFLTGSKMNELWAFQERKNEEKKKLEKEKKKKNKWKNSMANLENREKDEFDWDLMYLELKRGKKILPNNN